MMKSTIFVMPLRNTCWMKKIWTLKPMMKHFMATWHGSNGKMKVKRLQNLSQLVTESPSTPDTQDAALNCPDSWNNAKNDSTYLRLYAKKSTFVTEKCAMHMVSGNIPPNYCLPVVKNTPSMMTIMIRTTLICPHLRSLPTGKILPCTKLLHSKDTTMPT